MRASFNRATEFSKIARLGVPIVVLIGCLHLLSEHLAEDAWRSLPAILASMPVEAWGTAIVLTMVSFWAIGNYDAVAHRHLRTGITDADARLSGAASIGVAQSLGFGILTGAAVRWRILPGLSAKKSLGISTFVGVSFVAGWAVVVALACVILDAPAWTFWPSVLVLLAATVGAAAAFVWPRIVWRGMAVRLPTLKASGAIVVWAFVDTIAAAGALWMFLPDGAVSFSVLFPAYLIALGTALVSNTPGGVGPFEITLLVSLPTLGATEGLAAIIAFRAVYYGLPMAFGAIFLLRPLAARTATSARRLPETVFRHAPRSECQVVTQNGGFAVATKTGAISVWPTGQTLTQMCDAVSGDVGAALATLQAEADRRVQIPLIYKCRSETAHHARAAGWSVLHIADDAVVDPTAFDLDVPARRTLRRKLRAATKAGITIEMTPPWPWAELTRIDASWRSQHGTPRGGTMGRFAPDYVSHQITCVARRDGELIAFATFLQTSEEWTLDLMRYEPGAPDGTMHALVNFAITAARGHNIRRFSLAAVPACPNPRSAIWRAVSRRVSAAAGAPGLRQFKSAFAPDWQPRYAAAPGPVSLAVALADVAREVHAPLPVDHHHMQPVHDQDENYELSSRRLA